jgi:UDP-4-amino-4-deoxy-L-arabinose formyltransferase/UDP-glucuronic acid dehydrogenase (UDP-4-keto-hexauronic acid decarboxylating)
VRILLVAEESAGIQTLKWLADSGHELVAVMAAEPDEALRVATVGAVARNLGLELWPPEQVRSASLAERVRAGRVDLLLNVHSLFLVHPDVVAAPAIGSFNLHPGPLPQYAGLNAPSWAIYYGERTHAVTVHWMEPGIDTGAIAYESTFPIEREDTGLTVSAKCVRHGLPLLTELVAAAERGADAIPAIQQDLSRRRYFGREVPHGGKLDWSLPARRLVDFVRACDYSPFTSPWGHPRTRLNGDEVAVVKAAASHEPARERPGTVGRVVDDGVLVAAADEWVVLERVQINGRRVDAAEALPKGAMLATGRVDEELD